MKMKNITFSRSVNEGQIFELGFKLGAMHELESSKQFNQNIADKRHDIEVKLQAITNSTYRHELYDLININPLSNILQNLRNNHINRQIIKKIAFDIGLYYGQLFAKEMVNVAKQRSQDPQYRQSTFQIIAFDANNADAKQDRYFNADIMLLEQITKKEDNSKMYHLYVYEIKAGRYHKRITEILNNKSDITQIYTQIESRKNRLYFASSNGYKQDYFNKFLDTVITLTGNKTFPRHTIKRKYISQVCSYIFDFLRKKREIAKQVKAISFGIISAFHNYPIYHFYFDDISKIDIDGYAEKFKSLYGNNKTVKTGLFIPAP